ncbi:MAG: ATP-dependent Clp protease proteolytic subunit, partial [uncultured Rubrobacteraceae bacterium]
EFRPEVGNPLRHGAEPSRRADDGHLLAAVEGQDHLPGNTGGRSGRERGHGAALAPGFRGPRAGHKHLHKLARWEHIRDARDVRHHAFRQRGRGDYGARDGGFGRGFSSRGGDEGQEERVAEHEDIAPPAGHPGRHRGAGLRRGDSRQGDRLHQAQDQRDHGAGDGPAVREDRARHRPRLHLEPPGGRGIRRNRSGRHPSRRGRRGV